MVNKSTERRRQQNIIFIIKTREDLLHIEKCNPNLFCWEVLHENLSWSDRVEKKFGRPTCRDAGALLRAKARHRTAARRTSSGALDMQLSVVVAVISYSGPVYWLNTGGRRPTSGWVESAVVCIDRLREAGGQHYRAAPMQQQRLLAARPSGQDAVYAEHPGGHHPGEETGKGIVW